MRAKVCVINSCLVSLVCTGCARNNGSRSMINLNRFAQRVYERMNTAPFSGFLFGF